MSTEVETLLEDNKALELDKRSLAEQIRQLHLKLDNATATTAHTADLLIKKQNELAGCSIKLRTVQGILDKMIAATFGRKEPYQREDDY